MTVILYLYVTIDYTYLEDVSRQSDNITRSRLHVDREVRTKNAETKQKQFAKIVKQMGINYYSLPLGMSRNKLNQSNFSKKYDNYCKNEKIAY